VQPYSTQRSEAHANCFRGGLSRSRRSPKLSSTQDLRSRSDGEQVESCVASGNSIWG